MNRHAKSSRTHHHVAKHQQTHPHVPYETLSGKFSKLSNEQLNDCDEITVMNHAADITGLKKSRV
jgi:hypothetical protein